MYTIPQVGWPLAGIRLRVVGRDRRGISTPPPVTVASSAIEKGLDGLIECRIRFGFGISGVVLMVAVHILRTKRSESTV